jgi:PAS domain S-box-containing protein
MGILAYATFVVTFVSSASTLASNVRGHCVARLSWLYTSLVIRHETYRFRLRPDGFALVLEPSLWKLHPYYTIAGIMFFLAEGALIGVLLVESKRRRQAQASITRRFALERVVSELSTTLADCPPESIDREVVEGLHLIMEAEGADRVCWFAIPKDGTTVEKIGSAHRPGVPPGPETFEVKDVPWIAERLSRAEPVAIRELGDFPPDAAPDRQYIDQLGIKSIALVPSSSGTAAKGLLILVHLSRTREWPGAVISRLGVLGNLFGTALSRKWAQDAKQVSEQRFQAIFEQASLGIALEDMDGRILFANSALCAMLGYEQAEMQQMTCDQFAKAEDSREDWGLFQQMRAGLINSYQIEKRYVRPNGAEVWGNLHVSLLEKLPGEPSRVIAMVEDVTERKAANARLENVQLELQRLTARLIQAQEEERQRISGELHDDIAQRLSLLVFGLERLKDVLPASMTQLSAVSQLRNQAEEITTDIHELSHELHSTKLQHLGLKAALNELCQKIAAQRSIGIELKVPDVVPLGPDVQLCLYRVAQEALNNVLKHSGSSQVTVTLSRENHRGRLRVKDSGVGFDTLLATTGLGLASMRERLRIARGALLVNSLPGHGTEITAEVPLAENADVAKAS